MSFIPLHDSINYKEIKPNLIQIKSKKMPVSEILEQLQLFKKAIQNKSFGYSKKNSHQDAYKQQQRFTKIVQLSQNHQTSKYKTLQKLYKKQIAQIYSSIASFVLESQTDYRKIQLLPKGYKKSITLNKGQVVYLLCLMSLNLVPPQQYHNRINLRYNKNNNFSFIFDQQQYKTIAIIEYLKLFFQSKRSIDEKFTIKRQVINQDLFTLLKSESKAHKLSQIQKISSDNDSIQKYVGDIKVCFSNKFIGGGILTSGCVQEQIIFTNHPEMIVSLLLCEALKDDESILYQGFTKIFKNVGYSYDVKFDGLEKQLKYKYDIQNRANQFIVGIDAVDYLRDPMEQFSRSMIEREILKAYAGFSSLGKAHRIVTGNWGCGAFKGNLKLKFIIQWIACSLAGKTMVYCPYGQKKEFYDFEKEYYDYFKKQFSVLELYENLIQASKKVRSLNDDIFELIFKSRNKAVALDKRTSNYEKNALSMKSPEKKYQISHNNVPNTCSNTKNEYELHETKRTQQRQYQAQHKNRKNYQISQKITQTSPKTNANIRPSTLVQQKYHQPKQTQYYKRGDSCKKINDAVGTVATRGITRDLEKKNLKFQSYYNGKNSKYY